MSEEHNAPPAGWWSGLEETDRGHVANRGWDKLPPDQAAVAAYRAFREAESRLGIPAAEVLRMPRQDDPAGTAQFWQKLGAPTDPTGYKFENLAFSDGTSVEGSFLDAMRAAGAKRHVPADMLDGLVRDLLPHMEQEARNEEVATEAKRIEAQRALDNEWGANTARNKFQVEQARKTLGVPDDVMAALDGASPTLRTGIMKHFLAVAEMMGEARYVPGAGSGQVTKESAQAELDTLMRDTAWGARWRAGGAAEAKHLNNLLTAIHSGR